MKKFFVYVAAVVWVTSFSDYGNAQNIFKSLKETIEKADASVRQHIEAAKPKATTNESPKSEAVTQYHQASNQARLLAEKKIGFKGYFLGDVITKDDPKLNGFKCTYIFQIVTTIGGQYIIDSLQEAKQIVPDDYQRYTSEINTDVADCAGKTTLFQQDATVVLTIVDNTIVAIVARINDEDIPLMVSGLSKSLGEISVQNINRTAEQVREDRRLAMAKACNEKLDAKYDYDRVRAKRYLDECNNGISSAVKSMRVPNEGVRTQRGSWSVEFLSAGYETFPDQRVKFKIEYTPWYEAHRKFMENFTKKSFELMKIADQKKQDRKSSDF